MLMPTVLRLSACAIHTCGVCVCVGGACVCFSLCVRECLCEGLCCMYRKRREKRPSSGCGVYSCVRQNVVCVLCVYLCPLCAPACMREEPSECVCVSLCVLEASGEGKKKRGTRKRDEKREGESFLLRHGAPAPAPALVSDVQRAQRKALHSCL